MIDERMKQIEKLAQMYEFSLEMYGVDISGKLETATQMSIALENAYLRGRADGLKYACEREKERQKVGEWIPCSERLPKEAGFYLVTKRQRSGEIQVALGSYQPLFNAWGGNGNFKEVLAWMSIPEPYKENADD